MCRDGYDLFAAWVAEAEQWTRAPTRGDLERREQSDAYRRTLAEYRQHRAGCAVCGSEWPPDSVTITLDR